jgi:DNA mismatch repair protein MutS
VIFFELFFDESVIASKVLGLTLIKRHDQPMAGIPAHAADTYISKLLVAGKKVAICDQKEPATPGK